MTRLSTRREGPEGLGWRISRQGTSLMPAPRRLARPRVKWIISPLLTPKRVGDRDSRRRPSPPFLSFLRRRMVRPACHRASSASFSVSASSSPALISPWGVDARYLYLIAKEKAERVRAFRGVRRGGGPRWGWGVHPWAS